MKRDAASPSTRSRSRKKTAVAAPAPEPLVEPAESNLTVQPPKSAPDGQRNVSPLEGGISLTAGVLFLIGALFPRTLKQLLLLGIGGVLVHRGMTGKCGVYAALDIDTAKEPLLKQINEKFIAPSASEAAAS